MELVELVAEHPAVVSFGVPSYHVLVYYGRRGYIVCGHQSLNRAAAYNLAKGLAHQIIPRWEADQAAHRRRAPRPRIVIMQDVAQWQAAIGDIANV